MTYAAPFQSLALSVTFKPRGESPNLLKKFLLWSLVKVKYRKLKGLTHVLIYVRSQIVQLFLMEMGLDAY
jgi:hypothetical protein